MYNWGIICEGATPGNNIVYTAVLLMQVLQIMFMPTEVGLDAMLLQNGFQRGQQIHVVVRPVIAPDRMVSND